MAPKFLESSLASGKSGLQKVNAPKAYKQGRKALQAAFAVAAGLGGAALNFLKLDIIRDFAQNIALFFANIASQGLALARRTFGRLFGVISIDFNMVSASINPLYIIILLAVLAFILVITFGVLFFMTKKMNPDEIREGHEVVKWDERKEEQGKKVMFIKYGLLAGTFLYLPVSRALFQAIACGPPMIRVLVQSDFLNIDDVVNEGNCTCLQALLDNSDNTDADIIDGDAKYDFYNPKTVPSPLCPNDTSTIDFSTCDCNDWESYGTVMVIAAIFIILYSIGFPAYCVWLIRENKPYGSREDPEKCYDEEGNLVEYTDDRYQEDLKTDPNQLNCPYLTLYDGYERKWSFYKIWIMGTKLLLVLPAIFWFSSPIAQSILCFIVLLVLGVMSFYSTPFLDPTDDVLDGAGRVTSALTLFFSFLSALGGAAAFSALVMVVNSVNGLIMALGALWGMSKVRALVKSTTGSLQFSNSLTRVEGPAKKIIPHWNICFELKNRIWRPFWEAVLLEEGEVYAKRLTDMQSKARDAGKKRILDHWKNGAIEEMTEVREKLMTDYEGVDVYFSGESHDGKLNSKTCFGKMYILAYPFHAVMVYDDSDDYAFIWEDRTSKLLEENEDEEIQRRREVRQKLRGLCGPELTYHLQRWETHKVEDGTETYTDAQGNKKTRTKYASVKVWMTYSKGKLSISSNNDKLAMQAGFKFKLTLTDGIGEAVAPTTGKRHTIRNTASFGMADIDIDEKFSDCPALKQLFENSPNDEIWPGGVEAWQKKLKEYRDGLLKKRCAEEATLSSAFWLHIYDNDTATRDEVEAYFKNFEARDKVKGIPNRHKEGLDYLFNRMEWVNKHPCAAIWYVFWDDVWETNNETGKIKGLEEELDPSEENSMAFRPMKREDLETWLDEKGLKGKFRWFTGSVVDTLYELMESTDEDFSKFDEEQQSDEADHGVTAKKYSSGVQCAYSVRRNTPVNKVIHESLHGMEEGKVANIANYGGGAYIPRDIEGDKVSNPLENSEEKEDSE